MDSSSMALRHEDGNFTSYVCGCRAIGAVVYRVKGQDQSILKVSLRSLHGEDTTEISEVRFLRFLVS